MSQPRTMSCGGGAAAVCRLSLADGLLPACEALAAAVASGFGPSFKSTLVVSSTGKLLMTNSGLRIMRSLDVDHPCARLVVECASRHHDLTGDNAKSFVLLLAELLRLIAADAAAAGPLQQQRRQQQLAVELGRALVDEDVLPAMLRQLRDRAVVRVEASDPDGFRDALLDVIRGSLGCHLLEYDVLSLSSLARDYILGWATAGESDDATSRRRLPAILDLVLRHFDVLCVPCGNKPAASSRIVDGLLLSRCCHYAPRPRRRPPLATAAEDEGCFSSGPEEDDVGSSASGGSGGDDDDTLTRFLIMTCSLEAGGSDGGSCGDGEDDCSDDDSCGDGARATLALRAALVEGGGEPAAAAAGLLLKAFSTRADRVARFLVQCARAGVTLLVTTRTLSELERRMCHEYGVDYVHALPADEARLLATVAGVPLLHDAAECLLRGRLQSSAIGRARDCVQLQLGGAGAAGTTTYTSLVGVRSAACGARTLVACGPTDGLCQQLRDCIRDALRCVRSAIASSGGGGCRSAVVGADEPVMVGGGVGRDDDELTLSAFPVGGGFEITLHQLIGERLAQHRQTPAVASAAEALRLLADALLCVPRMLHANAFSFSKPRWPATLQDLKTSCSASANDGGCVGREGVHASTGTSARLSALQPLRSKELLVMHVVALARQLLRTDYILPASAAVAPPPMLANCLR